MSDRTREQAQPKSPIQENPIAACAWFGGFFTLLSLVIVTIAVSMDPVLRPSRGGTGSDVETYFTSGSEHLWLAVGAGFGIAGMALLAVAVIAKGLQLGRA